jgi:hypothetical protein
MQKDVFCEKSAPFYVAYLERFASFLRLARASIYKYKHSSGTRFLSEGVLVVTRGTPEQTTPVDRFAANDSKPS